MKTSPRIQSGPAGTSSPMKPETHSSSPAAPTWSTYWRGVSTKSLPARVRVTSGIALSLAQSTVASPEGEGSRSHAFSISASNLARVALEAACLMSSSAARSHARHLRPRDALGHRPRSVQICRGESLARTLSMIAGPYSSMTCLHSPSNTPSAPMALLIARTACLGPASSEVPESAMARQPPSQNCAPPTATASIANSQ
mmetsp:Transcript_2047/g.5083  ORF Transcript_2047/g.5083 Transcript_2047/m.5083 type:complete len:200 (-) Transcript_2047:797-1396(-)